MGDLNILFLRGAYLTKIDQLRTLLNDVSVTNSDDFREELLSSFRDGALASWCDKRGFALSGVDMSADNKPLYEAIVKKITGKTDFKAADKAFIGNFAEPLKDDDIKIDDDVLRVTIHPIKPTNDKFRFELKSKEGKKISKVQQIDWKDKTKNTAVSLTFDLKGHEEREFELWLNGSEKLKTVAFSNSFTVKGVTFNMVLVKHGTFTMGATPEMEDPEDDEKPAHKVTITKDYYMGETQVTQALWQAVMGNNPSSFKGDNNPVECVSWNYCQEFIKKLNALTGMSFRLPTEAEWEFAARGGNKSKHTQYAGSNSPDDVAWNGDNSGKTHPVAQKKPNELGIYDMSGNVWEWCNDRFGSNYYSNSPSTDPQGPTSRFGCVLRGGGWASNPRNCRLSCRYRFDSFDGNSSNGFRLALQLI